MARAQEEAELAMPITAGAAVIIVVLGVCGVAALYFAVKSYLWTRQDHSHRPEDDERRPESEDKKDRKDLL
jgi:hypothetical protein